MLPVFLSAWNDAKRLALAIWNAGEKPSAEEVEPAVKELEAESYDLED